MTPQKATRQTQQRTTKMATKISPPSQTKGAGGSSASQGHGITKNTTQAEGSSPKLFSSSGVLAGLEGIRRVKQTKNSGDQNLFAGSGATGLNSQLPWTKNSGSQDAY